jgi:hypothetical protein
MKNIMKEIEMWNPETIKSFQDEAKAHRSLVLQERWIPQYCPEDMYNIMSTEQRFFVQDIFGTIYKRSDFKAAFDSFIHSLQKTIINERILGVFPCDTSHMICVTEGNHYGIEFKKLIKGTTIYDTTAEVTIYCEEFTSNTDEPFIYKGEWCYEIENFLDPNFKVSVTNVEKEHGAISLSASYDNGHVFYSVQEKGETYLNFSFGFDSIWEPLSSFEYMENTFLSRSIESVYDAFFLFVQSLRFYENCPYALKENIPTHFYDISFKDKEGRTVENHNY